MFRLEKVVGKIVKGLYYAEHAAALAPQTDVETLFLRPEQHRDVAQKYGYMLSEGQRAWAGIFSYRANRVNDYPQGSMWELRFYDFAVFWALSHDDAVVNPAAVE